MTRELDMQVANALGHTDCSCSFDVEDDIIQFKDATWMCQKCGHRGKVNQLWRWTDFAHNIHVPHYSTDIAAAWILGSHLVGDEVAFFIEALCDLCGIEQEMLYWDGMHWASVEALNMLVYATPEQRCHAFLMAKETQCPAP